MRGWSNERESCSFSLETVGFALTIALVIERSSHSRFECFCIGKNTDQNLDSNKKMMAVFH